MNKLSVLLITYNADALLDRSLESVHDIAGEIVVVDSGSTDETIKIAKKHNAMIINTSQTKLGEKRLMALENVKFEWVLALDADEIVSNQLKKEIQEILSYKNIEFDGFVIPYQNHFLNRPIKYGGESYKILRLFRKQKVKIHNSLIHEKYEVEGKTNELKNKLFHYSYQSVFQIYLKFTKYALLNAQDKLNNGESTSWKKVVLYPLHMFWARFIEDNGYKDGIFRIPLDIGFAYMEFLTYTSMLFMRRMK